MILDTKIKEISRILFKNLVIIYLRFILLPRIIPQNTPLILQLHDFLITLYCSSLCIPLNQKTYKSPHIKFNTCEETHYFKKIQYITPSRKSYHDETANHPRGIYCSTPTFFLIHPLHTLQKLPRDSRQLFCYTYTYNTCTRLRSVNIQPKPFLPRRSVVSGMPKNSNYEHDIRYTLQMCQWVLKPIGIWPLVHTRTSQLEKIISVLLLGWCTFVLLFALIPPIRYMFVEEKSVYKRVKLMGPMGFCLASAIKYCYLGLKGSVFGRCFMHMERDWKTVEESNHRGIMLRQAAVSRHLIGLCAAFLYTAGLSYNTIMPFLSKARFKGNITVKPLSYPGYDAFFDTQSSPTYEIIFSLHIFAGFIRYSITTGAYSLAAIFVTHICGQIRIQIARLDDFVKRKQGNHDPLSIVVRDHVKILRLSKNIEEALREICFTEVVESTMIICLLEYYCLTEWQNSDGVAIMTYVMFLISFSFNVFIFCYISQILTDECSQIGPVSYNIDWYNMPPKKACSVILLNAISLYPPKLTAGKILELNFITFSSILQTSVVYLNLLRTFVYLPQLQIIFNEVACTQIQHVSSNYSNKVTRITEFCIAKRTVFNSKVQSVYNLSVN
ncbi:uncharacterized protein LOC143180130 [Calliopsis andreniformis]|uniref:uncharacterized protein LOC143180130 n=1 Tax=Calliopsis andreniformis TaxID=337506 RepID=UPI003FCCE9F0